MEQEVAKNTGLLHKNHDIQVEEWKLKKIYICRSSPAPGGGRIRVSRRRGGGAGARDRDHRV